MQGWVRITSYTDPPDNILGYEAWYVQRAGQWQPIEVEDGRVTAKGVLAKLAGKVRRHRIRVVLGDRVTVAVSPYDPTRGFIVYRQR